jgi:hypothetical protein
MIMKSRFSSFYLIKLKSENLVNGITVPDTFVGKVSLAAAVRATLCPSISLYLLQQTVTLVLIEKCEIMFRVFYTK